MDEVKIGIVGAGYIANVHRAAYRAVAGTFAESPRRLELVAVADTDCDRAAGLARAWGWSRAESDWTAVTRAEDIDVVDVSVPNALHAEIAVDALRHGKHVICEKPLAHDLEAAELMCAAARDSGRVAQVCFYYRLWPAIAWASSVLREGLLGEVVHFRGWMLQDYAADPSHGMGWRSTRAAAGAGALGDLGSHIIDIALNLAGGIKSVSAVSKQLVRRETGASELDDLSMMMLRFDSGATGVVEASWAMTGHKCDLGFDLVCEDGAIRFSWERANEIEILRTGQDSPDSGFERVLVGGAHPDAGRFAGVPGQGLGYRDAFTIGLGHAITAIATGAGAVAPTFEEGARVSRVIAAALESSTTGRWTALA